MVTFDFSFLSTKAFAPVDSTIQTGTFIMQGWKGLGTVKSSVLQFATEFSVQALVSDFTGSYGYGALTTTLSVEFRAGAGAPAFTPVMVDSTAVSTAVFIGAFGFGTPFTHAFMTSAGVTTTTPAVKGRDFTIDVSFVGLVSPTFNGAPTFASTPLNMAQAWGQVIYDINPHLGTAKADNIQGTVHDDAVILAQGNDIFRGGGGDDEAWGGAGNDQLLGDGGDDVLRGDAGDDRLNGGAGNDLLVGGLGHDVIVGGAGNDTLQGDAGHDLLQGDAGVDILRGGLGNDTLRGGAGNDRLIGDAGTDQLYGGSEAGERDVFVFNRPVDSTPGIAHDTIHDFQRGVDDIDLRGMDANTRVAGNQAFTFAGVTATAHAVWLQRSGSDLLVRADVNGDARADFELLLKNTVSLTAADFLF